MYSGDDTEDADLHPTEAEMEAGSPFLDSLKDHQFQRGDWRSLYDETPDDDEDEEDEEDEPETDEAKNSKVDDEDKEVSMEEILRAGDSVFGGPPNPAIDWEAHPSPDHDPDDDDMDDSQPGFYGPDDLMDEDEDFSNENAHLSKATNSKDEDEIPPEARAALLSDLSAFVDRVGDALETGSHTALQTLNWGELAEQVLDGDALANHMNGASFIAAAQAAGLTDEQIQEILDKVTK